MKHHEAPQDRKARLVARASAERERAVAAMASIRGTVAPVDRGIQSVSGWLGSPLVLASGLGVLLALGRGRRLRTASLALGLLSLGLKARRIGRTASPRDVLREGETTNDR